MPKIVDKEKMKNKILQAALNAFIKFGFHNTSMNKIAKEANIAKGTLYLYFDSKELLTEAIAEDYFELLMQRLVPVQYFTTLDALLNHIEKALLISHEESQFIPIFFEAFGPSFRSKSFIQKYDDFFANIGTYYTHNFEQLIEAGEMNKEMSPAPLGRLLVSMLDGIVLHKGFFEIPDKSYINMVGETMKLLRHGLNVD